MNPDMLRPLSVNGYHPSNVPSSSNNSNNYPSSGTPANYRTYSSNMPGQHHSPIMHPNPESHWPSQGHPQTFAYSHNGPHSQQWANQLPQNPYPNNMQGMNNMNFPFLPQQVIHDALALSTPVEAADEPVLVQAILSSRNRGETYKDALNGLHGKNGHSASLWKDYYLEHKERLDSWITLCLQADAPKATATAKKPIVAKPMLKRESSPSPTAESSPTPSNAKRKERIKKERTSTTPIGSSMLPRVGGRTTQNSLSAPEPVFDHRLPPPHTEIRVPPPPSRSPSPPRRTLRGPKGFTYTPEDREFFIKFIAWRLKGNPSLTRTELCAKLAEKTPHHTARSWASYWSNHHDLPDKILAAAHGEASGSEEDEDEKTTSVNGGHSFPPRRRPKYYESSLSSEGEVEEDVDATDELEGDDMPIQVYDESEMGPGGSPFTDADLYITAKHVASFPNFDDLTFREKWEVFHQRHPQRAAKSWAEYYRRYEKEITRLATRIRDERLSRASIGSQRARPSWAKRKHDVRSEDEDGGKRSRRD